jgi:hypothetical protein
MKRFYNNEPEPDDYYEENDFDEDAEDALSRMIFEEDASILGAWQTGLLSLSISFLSLGFFWKFKNYKTRLKEVQEVYNAFKMLTDPTQEEE